MIEKTYQQKIFNQIENIKKEEIIVDNNEKHSNNIAKVLCLSCKNGYVKNVSHQKKIYLA